MAMPDVSIIGMGALGSTLARAFGQQDIQIKSFYNRTSKTSRKLAKELDVDIFSTFPGDAEELGTLIFLTVPDSVINGVAEKLALLQDGWSGYSVVHCSGTESSAILSVFSDKGARVASFHPLQTFTQLSAPSDFEGISFDMEGNSELLKILRNVAECLGARSFEITPEAKRYLHASAVMASNYLVALLHASEQIADLGGLDQKTVRSALLPLMQQSLENVGKEDLPDALSGPIARGDSETVSRHLRLLNGNSDLLSLYKQLGKQALRLARQKETLNSQQITELENLLNS